MILPDLRRAISGLGHLEGEADGRHGGEGGKLMEGVGVAILSIAMVVQPGEDDRATGGTGGRCGEGVGEARSLPGQGIEVWGPDVGASVAPRDGTLVVGDKENNIGAGRARSREGGNEREEQGENEGSHLEDE